MMKNHLTKIEESVLKDFLYSPESWRQLLSAKYSDQKYAFAILKKYIPTDTGLEFEIGDANVSSINKELFEVPKKDLSEGNVSNLGNTTTQISTGNSYTTQVNYRTFLTDYNCDYRYGIDYGTNLNSVVSNAQVRPKRPIKIKKLSQKPCIVKDSSYEITLRLNKHTDYSVLIKFMKELNEKTKFPIGGGIHIHTNIHHMKLNYEKIDSIKRIVNNDKSLLVFLNNTIFQYSGDYNCIEARSRKGSILNIRDDFNTFEWRGINCTYSYSQLVKWIIICHLATRLILNCYNGSQLREFRNLITDINEL